MKKQMYRVSYDELTVIKYDVVKTTTHMIDYATPNGEVFRQPLDSVNFSWHAKFEEAKKVLRKIIIKKLRKADELRDEMINALGVLAMQDMPARHPVAEPEFKTMYRATSSGKVEKHPVRVLGDKVTILDHRPWKAQQYWDIRTERKDTHRWKWRETREKAVKAWQHEL